MITMGIVEESRSIWTAQRETLARKAELEESLAKDIRERDELESELDRIEAELDRLLSIVQSWIEERQK